MVTFYLCGSVTTVMPHFLFHCCLSYRHMLWWCTMCQVSVRSLLLLSQIVSHILLRSRLTFLFAEFFLIRREFMAVSEGGVPLVLCGGNIVQRNCIFPSPWLLVLTPVAEIGRPCKPLPGRSDFCWDYWRAWLLSRGCAWTWYCYYLTSNAFPLVVGGRSEASKPQAEKRWCTQNSGLGSAGGAVVWYPAKPSLQGTVKGFCLCKARAFLSFAWDLPT